MSFKKDEMLIMPAVDIKNGKCVQLVQGEPGSEMVELENPELVAKHWEDLGARNIHVIDLDGTINGIASLDTIEKILNEISIPIQLGGGIRSLDYARQLLNLDIERLIIGTMGIQHPETITELSDEYGSDRIMISLDSKDNKVVIKGWREKIDKSPVELSSEFKEYGAGSILFTNVDVEGLLGGFYTDPVVELKESVDIPIVYSGGITTIDDIKKLNESGVDGIVIGSALYKDKIDLTEALKYQKR
ncbi:1-(5-phosphoribosyl)-5-[(5-phosphoribosylamino)methylideneamino] imidazole-4-carboxamide isomerase [Methanobrevibacter gottschalkii]|uniref:1-(5-phosphoribosyl)-5-[(5-phosphoribosylamino)methylideneamino] imidazole-4-carboxamide isomerase n=2 Tax=Methanobrevibacter gottschalkii TaxID=190974 RepID=A0A3N5B2J8_9EURY|nr:MULTISPECIES: 1-(5-phosphoribosyl)-5-[(5-phosphoribosylamino)methylideneamino]imidazole-4-carboxamide isomerase [Methanobrevibacter]OEC98523.1 1-(5-phosphoribosyl)-5-[(5-phosphoribosylamino)methylideneamino]imidazole-4-carboxamide isomerase [Methanobrevibacter sp. A27]RPF51503.1 1-(5-phosphoribosyl)-5-[(5-phosphoribosylamino)methylideneamino] imidazole-4-carboxamide isomerase [Methanobrevibacter gottschalkii DSM 11977]SEK69112.1 1-(5-phosphoribosyl)-5-[(5-phosphoribosylamino)methylideneamino]